MILTEEMIRNLPMITEEELEGSRYDKDEMIAGVLKEAESMLIEVEKECGWDEATQSFIDEIHDIQ